MDDPETIRIARLEAEADIRAHSGPCLLCGAYRAVLQPGREGGLRVYCEICAIGTRTKSMRGNNR